MRIASFLCLALTAPAYAEPIEVDVELVLAVDISRSMGISDLMTQRIGYGAALTSPDVIGSIERGLLGRIGVTYVEWSDADRQRTLVDWTLIDDVADAEAVAARLVRETGGTLRETSISQGLLFAADRFALSPFSSHRRVIDISGDGPNNNGIPVTTARDRVLSRGITINGLPLMVSNTDPVWHLPDLDLYYRDCVIGGAGAFVVPVNGWEEFPDAVRRKLALEIAGMKPAEAPARLRLVAGTDCLIGEKIRERRKKGRK